RRGTEQRMQVGSPRRINVELQGRLAVVPHARVVLDKIPLREVMSELMTNSRAKLFGIAGAYPILSALVQGLETCCQWKFGGLSNFVELGVDVVQEFRMIFRFRHEFQSHENCGRLSVVVVDRTPEQEIAELS